MLLCFALEPSFDASYLELKAPDLCFSLEATETDEAALKTFLGELPYVKKYELSKRYLVNHVELREQTMNFAYLASCKEYSPDSGQVIINPAVSNTKCGDAIRFSINGRTAEFYVKEVMSDPVNSAPENRIPYFYMNERELAELAGHSEKGSFYAQL